MSDYNNMEIDFNSINDLRINNLVYFNDNIWTIYDIDQDNDILYLSCPNKNNLGVPSNEVHLIPINEEVMELCGFKMISDDSTPLYYIDTAYVQTKNEYVFINEQYKIDMKLNIINNYDIINGDIIIDEESIDDSFIWFHQIQNMFFDIFGLELISVE